MTTHQVLAADEIQQKINALHGRAAGVIYGFKGSGYFNRIWYDHWGSSVISSYGGALEELGLQPFFVDVETFCKLAFDRQLPDLVCTFNLNAGVTPITHWSMVPAVSAWFDIPTMPATADVLTICERKDTATLIAKASEYSVAQTYSSITIQNLPDNKQIIIKPRDLGGSVGIKKMSVEEYLDQDCTYDPTDIIQDFISGYDLTVPVVFQPSTNRYRCPAGVLYIPDNPDDQNWWHSEGSKSSGSGYTKIVVELGDNFEDKMQIFARNCQLGPYSRVDFRISTDGPILIEGSLNRPNFTFIEVNPLPTLRSGINFLNVVESTPFRKCFTVEFGALKSAFGNEVSAHALVLACALCRLD